MKRNKLLSGLLAGLLLLCGIGTAWTLPDRVPAAAAYDNETLAAYAQEVAEIVNRERAANGLPELTYSQRLCDAAEVRAKEIQTLFSHTRPGGKSCFTALDDAGIRYTYAGENIAYGQRSPEAVMDAWMHSDGHRANILNTRVTYIGIGVAERGGVYYWTQFFAESDSLEQPTETTSPQVTTTTAARTTATTSRMTTTTAKATTTAAAATTATAVQTAPADNAGALFELLCGKMSLAKLIALLKEAAQYVRTA